MAFRPSIHALLPVVVALLLPLPSRGADLPQANPAPAQDPLRDPTSNTAAWPDIRFQVVARTSATISAPMSGQLAEFPLRDGDRFAQGAVLARFVCDQQDGALAHAKAVLEEKRQILATNHKLHDLGTGSGLEYRVAAAQVEEAAADVQTATAVVANCTVTTPFAGRVAGVAARAHQYLGVGAPLLDILDDHALELELIVPSRWLGWLKPDTDFTATIEETGRAYPAQLTRLSGKVDAVSQSIRAYARLIDPAPELLSGMSGHATFNPPTH